MAKITQGMGNIGTYNYIRNAAVKANKNKVKYNNSSIDSSIQFPSQINLNPSEKICTKRKGDLVDLTLTKVSRVEEPISVTYERMHVSKEAARANSNMEDANTIIKEAEELFAQGKSQIEQGLKKLTPSDQVVLFLGNTGAGKSTLINYLSGCLLTAKKVNERWHINATNPKVRIGNSLNNSATTLPQLYKDERAGLVYCDLPGFGDTRGVAQKIANSLLINEVANRAQGIKVLLVTSQAGLTNDRGDGLRKAVEQVNSMFNNLQQLKGNVALVVTNLDPRFSLNSVKSELEKIKGNSGELKPIIELIEDNIEVSHAPSRNGAVESTDKDKILKLLRNKVRVLNNAQLDIPISEELKSNIKNIAHELNSQINGQIKQVYKAIQEKCAKIGNSKMTNQEAVSSTISILNIMLEEANKLQSLASSSTSSHSNKLSFEHLINEIKSSSTKINVDISKFTEEAESCHSSLQFIGKLIQVKQEANLWLSEISEIIEPKAIKVKITTLEQKLQHLKTDAAQEQEKNKQAGTKANDLEPAKPLSTYRSYVGTTVSSFPSGSSTSQTTTTTTSTSSFPTSTNTQTPKYERRWGEDYYRPYDEYGGAEYAGTEIEYYKDDEKITKEQYYRESGEREPSWWEKLTSDTTKDVKPKRNQ